MGSVAGKRGEISGKSGGSMAGRYTQGTRKPEPCLRSRCPFLWPTQQELSRVRRRRPDPGGRGSDKTASKQRGGGWKIVGREEGAARSKHRYGKRLGQVVTVTMVGAPIVIAARYTEATPRILDNCTADCPSRGHRR